MKIGKHLDNNAHTKLDITRNGGIRLHNVYITIRRTYGPGAYNKFADTLRRDPLGGLARTRHSLVSTFIENWRIYENR